jgi:hypothetical protein
VSLLAPGLGCLHPPRPDAFASLLSGLCATALLACAGWWWAVSTVVIVEAARCRGSRPVAARGGMPRWAQRLVLAGCGAALLGASHLAPAAATSGPAATGPSTVVGRLAGEETSRGTAGRLGTGSMAGLPLPDRTTGPLAAREPPGPPGPPHSVTVQPGDSLWRLAERLLAPGAPVRDVADLVDRLHELNRAVIGADPDLIHPGHQLRTPLPERPPR